MKKTIIFIGLASMVLGCNKPCPDCAKKQAEDAAATTKVTKDSLKTLSERLNYAVAYDMGKSVTRNKLDFKEAIFLRGLKDGMNDEKNPEAALLDEKARIDTKREHSVAMREKEKKEREAQGKINKEAGEKFLAENKTKEGVVTTESGLQYKIIKTGNGPKPKAEDRVSVHYTGTLIDGTVFDSSVKRGKPATFPVNRVIKGWTEALQLMPVGSKWKIFVPAELGYGERGAGGKIGPNSTLIFDIELLKIVSADAAQAKPAMVNPHKNNAKTQNKPEGTKPVKPAATSKTAAKADHPAAR